MKDTILDNNSTKVNSKNVDLISRQAAIDAVNKLFYGHIALIKRRGLNKAEKAIAMDVIGAIESVPSAQPERKKGKWFVLDECANEGVYCSVCHKKVFKVDFSNTMKWKCFKFCPHCGARMENGI